MIVTDRATTSSFNKLIEVDVRSTLLGDQSTFHRGCTTREVHGNRSSGLRYLA